MAQQNALNAALICLGFNADTSEPIINEGFEDLVVLSEVEEDDIDQVIKNVRETRHVLGAHWCPSSRKCDFPFPGYPPP
jgi:hypothetical protein